MKRIIAFIIVLCLSFSLISCGAEKIKTPSSDVEIVGADYRDVEKIFKNLGFTNVKTEKTEDLLFGFFSDEDEVKKVLIDGEDIYKPDTPFSADSEILIIYHAYPDIAEENVTTE